MRILRVRLPKLITEFEYHLEFSKRERGRWKTFADIRQNDMPVITELLAQVNRYLNGVAMQEREPTPHRP